MFTILDYSSALEYGIIWRYTNIVYFYFYYYTSRVSREEVFLPIFDVVNYLLK